MTQIVFDAAVVHGLTEHVGPVTGDLRSLLTSDLRDLLIAAVLEPRFRSELLAL